MYKYEVHILVMVRD